MDEGTDDDDYDDDDADDNDNHREEDGRVLEANHTQNPPKLLDPFPVRSAAQ